jgi:hypothetical protein
VQDYVSKCMRQYTSAEHLPAAATQLSWFK